MCPQLPDAAHGSPDPHPRTTHARTGLAARSAALFARGAQLRGESAALTAYARALRAEGDALRRTMARCPGPPVPPALATRVVGLRPAVRDLGRRAATLRADVAELAQRVYARQHARQHGDRERDAPVAVPRSCAAAAEIVQRGADMSDGPHDPPDAPRARAREPWGDLGQLRARRAHPATERAEPRAVARELTIEGRARRGEPAPPADSFAIARWLMRDGGRPSEWRG
ncbi:hypothetical protein tb265_45950 [Gemmatimonadetes bacterium T265]|nr:hypothetical protein tb265_45950 [Gemmatimonadetes bacterium T265]